MFWQHVKAYFEGRSPQWPKERKQHLIANPTCACCGGIKKLEVHHIEPFQNNPARELDPTNFITLCNDPSRMCHFIDGHLCNWQSWNKNIVAWARQKLYAISNRP